MIAIIIFILAGILIKYGKMYFLIAGYNTMSKEKKAQYDIESLANMMGNVFFIMALIIMIGYLVADWLDNENIEIISTYIAVLICVPYILIKANSSKYRNKKN